MNLEKISTSAVADTSTQSTTRSCVIGGINLGSFVVAIESGDSLDVGQSLRRNLETRFRKPVQHFFLTHTHTDHRKGMNAFKDVNLIISSKCLENMPTSVRLSKWSVESFEQSMILDDDITIEFHLVAGHSVGSSIAFIPQEKVLFGGDLFIEKRVNFGLPFMGFYQNRPKKDGNPDEYLAAYDKFRKMRVEVIVPGHGNIILDAPSHLDEQISFFRELKKFILSEIKEGKSLEEIELPRLEPIEYAFTDAESRTKRSAALRFLKHYLDVLKTSFYTHYSQNSGK